MKTMFDTSVLVPALSEQHPDHFRAFEWLHRAKLSEFPLFIASHSLAECYATLTAKAPTLSIPPLAAAEMIRQNLMVPSVTLVDLNAVDYQAAVHAVASLGLWSGIIYDAILVQAAKNAGVTRLVTFNIRHFKQLCTEVDFVITAP